MPYMLIVDLITEICNIVNYQRKFCLDFQGREQFFTTRITVQSTSFIVCSYPELYGIMC